MIEFVMPSLGADMEKGTVIQWLVKPGDAVHRGDIVVEIETEKSDMEVEIFHDGVIADLVVAEGETVPVGALLARLEPAAGGRAAVVGRRPTVTPAPAAWHEARPEPGAAVPAPEPAPRMVERATHPLTGGEAPHQLVTPLARRLAAELGMDVSHVHGSGVDGRTVRADVERAAAAAKASRPSLLSRHGMRASPYARRLAAERGADLTGLQGTGAGGAIVARDVVAGAREPTQAAVPPPAAVRPSAAGRAEARQRMIGALMARSKREIPHYYLKESIDVTASLAWLRAENAKRPLAQRVLFSALLLRAVAVAAVEFPEMNGHFVDDEYHPSESVHLGVAISLRDGSLVTPALLEAQAKPLDELMSALRDLVERTRAGKLRASEMSSGTLTVTNLGDTGVELVHGIIFPPQVALVGFGTQAERPWAENGMVGVRTVVTATLAGDHRVSNGHRGGLFLGAIARNIQNPEKL